MNPKKDNTIPSGANFANAWSAAVNNSEESPAHAVIEHYNAEETQERLQKIAQQTGLVFYLIPDLIQHVLDDVYAKVIDHKDFHDNYSDGSDESWNKIKQYDVINNHLMNQQLNLDFDYYHWNYPAGNSTVVAGLDDEDLELARHWGGGELRPELSVYTAHCNALNNGKMVATYNPKTEEFNYYMDAEKALRSLQSEKIQGQANAR